jgi:hypothetical protein
VNALAHVLVALYWRYRSGILDQQVPSSLNSYNTPFFADEHTYRDAFNFYNPAYRAVLRLNPSRPWRPPIFSAYPLCSGYTFWGMPLSCSCDRQTRMSLAPRLLALPWRIDKTSHPKASSRAHKSASQRAKERERYRRTNNRKSPLDGDCLLLTLLPVCKRLKDEVNDVLHATPVLTSPFNVGHQAQLGRRHEGIDMASNDTGLEVTATPMTMPTSLYGGW